MPFKKNPEEHGSLADQLREKVKGETVEQTKENVMQTIVDTPKNAVDFHSRLFGKQITLREIRDPNYTEADIRGFFSALFYADTLHVSLNELNGRLWVTPESIFTIKLGVQKYTLPVSLFRLCLPGDIQSLLKNDSEKDYFKKYKKLFNSYDWRRLKEVY